MKGSVAPPRFPRMHQEGGLHTAGDSRDGGRRPPIHLVSSGCSKWGGGHLLGPLIRASKAVPPGFPWIRQGGFNHYDSTMRGTEGAELGPPNLASGGLHHGEV